MTLSVAVSGASGYAGGEILRLLAAHPDVEIRTVTAHSSAGQPLVAHQPHLRSLAHLELQPTTPEVLAGHDVVFLALPHGQSAQYTDALADTPLVIDAGADHRLVSAEDWAQFYGGPHPDPWAYGVPELPVAGVGVDVERHVAHAQARVSARLAIGRRAAPVLREEQGEAFGGRAEVLFGVHRLQHLVGGDAAIERVDQPTECLHPAHLVVEADGLGHDSSLSSARTAGGVGLGTSAPGAGGRSTMAVGVSS